MLALTRSSIASDTPCPNCGRRPSQVHDQAATLITAIGAQPRNRTTRQRTSPRTKKQRQTEHTRDVTYEINIVMPNLPKVDETPCL